MEPTWRVHVDDLRVVRFVAVARSDGEMRWQQHAEDRARLVTRRSRRDHAEITGRQQHAEDRARLVTPRSRRDHAEITGRQQHADDRARLVDLVSGQASM